MERYVVHSMQHQYTTMNSLSDANAPSLLRIWHLPVISMAPSLNPQVNILGTVHSDDPKTLQQLVVKLELSGTMGQPTAKILSAAAGSAAQLQQVEDELKQTRHPGLPTQPKPEPVDPTSAKPAAFTKPRLEKMSSSPKVNFKPFQVILKKTDGCGNSTT